MSTLYLARDEAGAALAVKVLDGALATQAEQVAQFVEAALIGASVEHANLLSVLGHGSAGDSHFLVMEQLEGRSLDRVMEEWCDGRDSGASGRRLLWASIIAQAAEGLHQLHQAGYVHCDVTPGNLFVTTGGVVKVIDFGLARRPGPARGGGGEGGQPGTYAYLAPERVLGGLVDARADIFALAVILYEATTARRLFKGKSDGETLANISSHNVRAPHREVADYPRRLEGIVMRGLRREPDGRHPTAEALAEELYAFVRSEGGEAVGPGEIAELLS